MFSLNQVIANVKESSLWSYGWHIEDAEDYLDRTIEVGEFVWFYDDEADTWSYGVYEGWYSDHNKAQETSPYFNEAHDGIDRLVITDSVINPDGTLTIRRNYALPENVYEGFSGSSSTFDLMAA